MQNSFSDSYKAAGVDITAGYRAVGLIKSHVERTRTAGFIGGLGGFGGLYALNVSGVKEPVLVSGTDGVGTKLRIAFLMDKHSTIGIDCVAMCVNDIICSLAKPLVFLDYIACGKNIPHKIAAIVEGVAEGCVEAGCSLVGGETAEMPGFYTEGEYDLAGFSTGIVDRSAIPTPESIQAGDVVIGLASSGVHSNGFSLIRKIFLLDDTDTSRKTLAGFSADLGHPLGEELLTPTRIYVKAVTALAAKVQILGLSHITGGGFYENMPRCLPAGKKIRIYKERLVIPPIFSLIQKTAAIPQHDMFNTFNMGTGMILVVRPAAASAALAILHEQGESAGVIGEVVDGEQGVELV
ncbi:MAG: phosphoribosylformylglycinamidine cyclo-ligase [Spirochaetaceae bacterium]|jgi:phosphoribosylformylglycinamidine cyclo-ligase|nr:phosphoribosylformylglycinamidine cyclo-ligase [Spirochaetaceae bacterium]